MRHVCLLLAAALWPLPAAAQIPGRGDPGPFVVDVRGATAGLPSAPAFYPPADGTIAISSRGFGLEAGGHVYFANLGPARVGAGVSIARVRGTSQDASATVRLLAPQVSFNFGSRNGWSYVSAGVGTGQVDTDLRGVSAGRASSGSVRSLNAGGGARWFLTGHVGVGFDLRFHRLAAAEPRGDTAAPAAGTPQATLMTASVGVSIK